MKTKNNIIKQDDNNNHNNNNNNINSKKKYSLIYRYDFNKEKNKKERVKTE